MIREICFLLFFFHLSFVHSKEHRLSLCTFLKTEEKSLKDWIEHHSQMGVDHFYLYDNSPSSHYQVFLSPYVQKGLVTLIQWPDYWGALSPEKIEMWPLGIKLAAYENALYVSLNQTEWLGFLESHEYLVSPEGSVLPILQRYHSEAALAFPRIKAPQKSCLAVSKMLFKPELCTEVLPSPFPYGHFFKDRQLPLVLKEEELYLTDFLDFQERREPDSVEALKEQIVTVGPHLRGKWSSQEKVLAFVDLILTKDVKLWVEIGVFGGASLFPVLSTFNFLKKGKAIAIDPWDYKEYLLHFDRPLEEEELKAWGDSTLQSMYALFQNMLKKYELTNYCTLLQKSSREAVSEISDPIDVLHIDGNDCGEGRYIDALLYLPKVRPGGYIWIQFRSDTLWERKCIDFLTQSCDLACQLPSDGTFLFRKRE